MKNHSSPEVLRIAAMTPECRDERRIVGPNDFDPIVEVLLQDAAEITAKLDPIVRQEMKNNPEALAEWDEIMQEFYQEYPEHRPVEH